MYLTFSPTRGYGALFLMHRHAPSRMLKALDMRNRAFGVVRGHYFKHCWRIGQVRHPLAALLAADRHIDEITSLAPMLSVAVLRSSFAEPNAQVRGTMWRPWLKFLKRALSPGSCCHQNAHCVAEFPRAWEIDAAFDPHKVNKNESDEEDDGSSAEEGPDVQVASTNVAKDQRSSGFTDFLQFLELGCGGSPLQGYPAVIVILSSIPPSVCIHPPVDY